MSQENVEVVRRVYDALNHGDWDAVFRDMHPDFEMTTQRGPSAGTRRGRDGVQGVEAEKFFEKRRSGHGFGQAARAAQGRRC